MFRLASGWIVVLVHFPTAGLLTIERGVPNLTGLFSLQNVTPIHVAPSVWLGLHWKGLRGEAVAAGMITGRQEGGTCTHGGLREASHTASNIE